MPAAMTVLPTLVSVPVIKTESIIDPALSHKLSRLPNGSGTFTFSIPNMDLSVKHVFITGAAKRVGRVIAETLLKDPGAKKLKLSAHYFRSKSEAESLKTLGESKGHAVHLVQADLADLKSVRLAAESAEAKFGAVDI